MKIFGIQMGGTAQETVETVENTILKTIERDVKNKHHVPRKLNYLCLKNPEAVASLVFRDELDKDTKYRLLFLYSTDHTGSCWLRDNPNWARMMRDLIIPRTDELSGHLQLTIKWYQDVHGL